MTARLFALHRDRDISGVSGTGIVADGVCWPDGTVSIRWRGAYPSTVSWNSVEDAEHVHGHGGATRIVWTDADDTFAADLDAHLDATARIAVLGPAHPLVRRLRNGPSPAGGTAKDCPACEAGIPHTEHCPTPETHNWGCGCPTDTMRRDTAGTVPDKDRTPDTPPTGQSRTPETPQANSTGQQDTAPDTEQDSLSHEFRDHLGVLLSRLIRGAMLSEERTLLREHVEHLLRRLDQTAAGRATWKAKAEEMERDRDRSDDAARRCLEQRQELAAERYAWQERGLEAEAHQERLRDLLRTEKKRADAAIERETTAEQAAAEAQTDRDQHAAVLREILDQFTRVAGHGELKGYQLLGMAPTETYERWRAVLDGPAAELNPPRPSATQG